MKKLSFIALGIIIGIISTLSFSASADSVKQYILTKIGYPIMVNGQEYSDPKFPALNYEGTTYLPLKGIGDVLGTPVKWNEGLKRVDVGNVVAEGSFTSLSNRLIYKFEDKKYTLGNGGYLYVDSNKNYYADLSTMVQFLWLAYKVEFEIKKINNPFVDGELNFIKNSDNISHQEKYLDVSKRYYELTYTNDDKTKSYFISTKPNEEQGGVPYQGAFLVPIDKVFSTLGMPGFSIERDDPNKMIYIIPN